ncbi:MAG: hypothetical protein IJP31_11650 [Lachnospiraceae bacterium]|nr:hypothetical protein [Lachnospiraceae bacterium]
MFSIFLQQLICSCESMQQMAYRQRQEREELNGVIRELGSLSGMGDIVSQLKGKEEELYRQQQSLLDMMQGLERIQYCYHKAEERIVDNADGAVRVEKPPFGVEEYGTFADYHDVVPGDIQ